MVAATSTSNIGLAIWTVGLAAATWIAKRLSVAFKYRNLNGSQHLDKVFEGGFQDALTEVAGIAICVLVAWIGFFPVVIYREYATQTDSISTLTTERNSLRTELDSRKNVVPLSDPAFSNIAGILGAFQSYRSGIHNKPCVIYITAPSDSTELASMVARLSSTVSGCWILGPGMGKFDPDVDEMTRDGIVPNVIVVHTERGNSAGLTLQENLSAQIQTQLSYAPPKVPRNHLYGGKEWNGSEPFIWLQFGSGAKWNSERFK
jgi:hypothetical protein